MDYRIWIIIPVYNRKQMTRACLESLSRQNYRNFEIIVVDDGSLDGTEAMIKDQFPHVQVLRGDGNLFWTKAINLGVQTALKEAANNDYILTVNNDLTVNPDYLDQLISLAEKSPKSLIGSIFIDADDNEIVLDGGVLIHWLTAKFEKLNAGKKYKELMDEGKAFQEVDVLSGRGALIPARVFKEIGLYNAEQLPHHEADYEFSIRAKRKGYKLLVSYMATVMSNAEVVVPGRKICANYWKDYLKSFTSIRSPNNLQYRWNFSQLCCPGFKGIMFYFFDSMRVIFGALRNQCH